VAGVASTAVTVMKSGGTRINEKGETVTFFLRQTPRQVSHQYMEAAFGVGQPHCPYDPWPALRSALPYDLLKADQIVGAVQQSLSQVEELEAYQASRNLPLAKVELPTRAEQSSAKAQAMQQGLAKSGWAYDQQIDDDGKYKVVMNRLYSSKLDRPIAGEPGAVPVPTRRIELYELARGETGGPEAPPELAGIQVHVPGSGAVMEAGEAGSIVRASVVDCHEIGKDFLLFRACNADGTPRERAASNPPPVLLESHGMAASFPGPQGEFSPPAGSSLAFAAPHGHVLWAPSPLLAQEVSPSSVHRVNPGGGHEISVFGSAEAALAPQALLERHAGVSVPGKVVDVPLSKVSAPFGMPGKEAQFVAQQLALHNPKEAAAWLAHDSGKDVVVVRRGDQVDMARLSKLYAAMEAANLPTDRLIELHMCRDTDDDPPVYGIAKNPPAGSAPVAQAKLRLPPAAGDRDEGTTR